jgi:hypothetical protein
MQIEPEPVFTLDDVECKYIPSAPADQRRAYFGKKLPGATVLARATISSEMFPKGIQFYADVESLIVLRTPRATVAPPPSASPINK